MDLSGQFRGRETDWRCGQCQHGFGYPAHSRLVEIDAAHFGLAELRGQRQVFQRFIADEAGVDTADCVQESFQNAPEPAYDLGEGRQRPPPSGILWCCAR